MLRTIERRLAGRNTGEVAALVLKNLTYAARRLHPAVIAARWRDGAFDRRWGTETSRLVNLGGLSVDRDRARHGVRYQPSSEDALVQAIAALAIAPPAWDFVDYGSGKGRIVLTAARLGFRQAIGLEFAPELFRAAEENSRRFMIHGGTNRAPRFVLGDAARFDPPAGPMLAYFYNPFGPAVLDEVIARLEAKAAGGDPVLVVYVDPRHLDRFAAARWQLVRHEAGRALLRAA